MINKRNVLDHQIRNEIYIFILKNPGLHFSELSRKLEIPKSTLDYHLNFLMKNNFISVRNDGGLKRFYISGKVGTKDKNLLGFLRKEVPFKIILSLLFPGHCSETELSKDLKLAFSTVNFHLNKLITKEIIKPAQRKSETFISSHGNKNFKFLKKQGRREIFYTFKNYETSENICRLLKTYKNSLVDPKIIDAYCDFIEERNHMFERNKNIKPLDFNSTIDNFIDILKEIFHFPFHF